MLKILRRLMTMMKWYVGFRLFTITISILILSQKKFEWLFGKVMKYVKNINIDIWKYVKRER